MHRVRKLNVALVAHLCLWMQEDVLPVAPDSIRCLSALTGVVTAIGSATCRRHSGGYAIVCTSMNPSISHRGLIHEGVTSQVT